MSAPAATPAPAPAPSGSGAGEGDAAQASAAPAAVAAAPSINVSVVKSSELAVVASGSSAAGSKKGLESVTGTLGSFGGGPKVAFAAQADAPSCAECGSIMVRNGSCYKCLNCGSTSGCS